MPARRRIGSSSYRNKTHAKLLATELLSLTVYPTFPRTFYRRLSRSSISRAEILGIVVSVDSSPKFLKFLLDDGTGCVPCILWLNPFHPPSPSDDDPTVDIIRSYARMVRLGEQLRARGRITVYRGELQITVRDLLVERDPNMEILHRLDCVRIARQWMIDRAIKDLFFLWPLRALLCRSNSVTHPSKPLRHWVHSSHVRDNAQPSIANFVKASF